MQLIMVKFYILTLIFFCILNNLVTLLRNILKYYLIRKSISIEIKFRYSNFITVRKATTLC